MNSYLAAVHAEARARGYAFDASELGRARYVGKLTATDGQLEYEWDWLLHKLRKRNPVIYRQHRAIARPAHTRFSASPTARFVIGSGFNNLNPISNAAA